MENDNKLVRNGCKEMHGVWINSLAVKNGQGNGMLYGLTIGGKIFCKKGEVQGSGYGHGFVFIIFHEFSRLKTNCAHNVISLMNTWLSCNL